jgi:hypothetical protein
VISSGVELCAVSLCINLFFITPTPDHFIRA